MKVHPAVRGAVLLAIVLGSGVFMGIAYERQQGAEHGRRGGSGHEVLRHLTEELSLDSAQAKAIGAVLARHQGEVDSTWHAMQPRVRAMLDSTSSEILKVLTPEQGAKYRTMVKFGHGPGH